jgi:putative DNA primase/helicase
MSKEEEGEQNHETTGEPENKSTGPQDHGSTGPQDNANSGAAVGAFAKAAAFGKDVGGRGEGGVEDIYLWEHGTTVEPWPEPVDGKVLLDGLECLVTRFAVLPRWASVALALWVVHTYAFLLRQVATYIGVESPEKRCGKTTLLTVLCELVNRPVVASNISSPAFFRVIAEKKPTLLIDEADTVLHRNRELKGIINAGYARKTGYVIRMTPWKGQTSNFKLQTPDFAGGGEGDGEGECNGGIHDKGLELARFSSYCPKAIATIKHLPETLADRCIVIQMQRKSLREKCERLRNLKGDET